MAVQEARSGPVTGFLLTLANVTILTCGAPNGAADGAAEATSTQPTDVTITIVYDNNPGDPRLETAWGFGCVIDGAGKTILFDTGGDGRILLSNMKKLEIDPGRIDVVVLSHSHLDHVGGLSALLQQNHGLTVYALTSFPPEIKQVARQAGARLVEVHEACEICPGVRSTGEIGGRIKEQSLVIDTRHGAAVITGCAHPGIVAIARKAREMTGSPVHFVAGGFHMGGASDEQIESVIKELTALGVERAAPCHCSGDRTRELFAEAFGERFVAAGVGAELHLDIAARAGTPSQPSPGGPTR
jgi:7,8-dihydropterin-6-yl-methyl-4-(beta-D-ribofuranosyl)aminobenzene 5'-phosphate synthase